MAVIGGGSGGLVVASVASRLGLDVTLIDAGENLGGDCLHYGCVPSKALLQAAHLHHAVGRLEEFGLPAVEMPKPDLGRINRRVRERVALLQKHDDVERFRSYGCDVILERGQLLDRRTVRAGNREIRARRIVIATGSSSVIPSVDGLERAGYVTHRDVFSLESLPPRLVVFGGGPIGIEFAQAFARLGSRVTVIQRSDRILPNDDPEASRRLQGLLSHEGVSFLLDSEPLRVEVNDGIRTVVCRTPKGEHRAEGEQILIAAGRRPNVAGLGLESAGVDYDNQGVRVDRRQRTSARGIYACGDVCGPYRFTHMAEHQAGVVVANAVFRWPKKVDYGAVPWVTYTDPELAHVGSSEQQARDAGLDVEVVRFAFDDVDRAQVERENHGFVKLVVAKRPWGIRRIVGATVLGNHGGELLPAISQVMRKGGRLGDIAGTIHAYPTRGQVHRQAVNAYFGERLFTPWLRRVVRALSRLP